MIRVILAAIIAFTLLAGSAFSASAHSGYAESGCTVSLTTPYYDAGRIRAWGGFNCPGDTGPRHVSVRIYRTGVYVASNSWDGTSSSVSIQASACAYSTAPWGRDYQASVFIVWEDGHGHTYWSGTLRQSIYYAPC